MRAESSRPAIVPASASSSAVSPWVAGAMLALLIVVAYARALHGGFVWDDDSHITANPRVVDADGYKDIWFSAQAAYYPLVTSLLWAMYRVFGANPVAYHVASLLFHVLAAVLLWRVLRRLAIPGAWLGAALWALHPVQVTSVAWICEIKNTQSAVFFLAAVAFYLRWHRADFDRGTGAGAAPSEAAGRGPGHFYLLAMIAAIAALLSKTSTVTLPIACGLAAWWTTRRFTWRDAASLAPFCALSLAAALWTIWEQRVFSGASGVHWDQSFAERLILAGRTTTFYLGKLAWPDPLVFIYPRWTIDAGNWLQYVPGTCAVLALLGLWWWRDRGTAGAFFAYGFFLALLFPVMGFFNIYYFAFSFVSDHLQYLASMGPLAFAGAVIALGYRRLEARRAAPWTPRVAALLALTFALMPTALSWRETARFESARTLYEATLRGNPRCWMAYNNLSLLDAEAGDFGTALANIDRAIECNPGGFRAYANRGNFLLRLGRPLEAVEAFSRAATLRPDLVALHGDLARAQLQAGRRDDAVRTLDHAVRDHPGFALLHFSRGQLRAQLGKHDDATGDFAEAMRIEPRYAEAEYWWARSLLALDRFDDAIRHFSAALKLQPGVAEVHWELGRALGRAGRAAEAEVHVRRALELKPKLADQLK